ncbi:MAG: hypothetical protein FJY85_09560, partial [Deltaproteobacteria bacterium]|nr:hypothetical protein [Deltaproteobacteria bacterium]
RRLQDIAKTSFDTLCDNKIGIEWDAIRWFFSEGKVDRRFDTVRLTSTGVSSKVLSYGNATDLKEDIRTLLSREEDRGLPYRELRDSFYKYRGLAVLLDESYIRETLRDMEGELVFIGQDGRRSDGRLPSWYLDAQVILAQHAPPRPPEKEITEEKETKPQLPLWGERGAEVQPAIEVKDIGPSLPIQEFSYEGGNVATPAMNVEREQDTTQFYEEARLTIMLNFSGPQAASQLTSELRALVELIETKEPRQVRAELSLKLPDMSSPQEVLEFLKGFDDRVTEKARLEGKVRRR